MFYRSWTRRHSLTLMSSQSLKTRLRHQHAFLLSHHSHLVNTSPHQESCQCLHHESQGAPLQSLYQQTEQRQWCGHLISLCGEKCFYMLTRAAFRTCTASFTASFTLTLSSLLHSQNQQSSSCLCWQLQSQAARFRVWNENLCGVKLLLLYDFYGFIPFHFCALHLSVESLKPPLSWRKKKEQ